MAVHVHIHGWPRRRRRVRDDPKASKRAWVTRHGGAAVAKPEPKARPSSSLEPAPSDRGSWPAHIKSLRLPPAWTDVKISSDPAAPLQATGKDVKGRTQYVYAEKFKQSQQAKKFDRVKTLQSRFDQFVAANEKNLKGADLHKRELAAAALLIIDMGLRPGGESDTKADKKAYGATTLESQHVVTGKDGSTRLRFVGKKGVNIDLPVENATLAKDLQARAKKGGQLFPGISSVNLLRYIVDLTGGAKTKDLRTLKGTSIANDMVKSMPAPTSATAYKKAVKQVAETVAQKLGNTPIVALQSYINPVVFAPWQQAHA